MLSCRHDVPAPDRRVVITVDDLPFATELYRKDKVTLKRMTKRLLDTTRAQGAPVIGFVNEAKLERKNLLNTDRVDLLRMWVAAGGDLGNHTYSHVDLHKVDAKRFIDEIVRGEASTRSVLSEAGRPLEYFRHPFLHTGRDPATRTAVETALARRGYRVAPVTIDNYDYIYARAYEHALRQNDEVLAQQIGKDYVEYMIRYFRFYERTSRDLLGYELPQILLIHANVLNADYLGALLDRVRERGYRFIDLDEALTDPAYGSKDDYFGPGGITWLHRWALTRKMDPSFYDGEPEVDQYVARLAAE